MRKGCNWATHSGDPRALGFTLGREGTVVSKTKGGLGAVVFVGAWLSLNSREGAMLSS